MIGFSPDSVVRQVSDEAVLLIAGGRALLMQLAHPLIAAGVAEHSAFQSAPLARLQRTVDLVYVLIYGTPFAIQAALGDYFRGHVPIRGQLAAPAGRYASGQAYDAADGELRLWVWATLVDSQRLVYERFVAPLDAESRRMLDEDFRHLGALMGVPPALLPSGQAEFDDYIAEMIASDRLAVSSEAASLAHALLNPPVGVTARSLAGVVRAITPGLLPERLRAEYGLTWSAGRERALDLLGAASRAAVPILPAWLRRIGPPGGDTLARWVMGG